MNPPPSYVLGRRIALAAIAALVVIVTGWLVVRYLLTGNWEVVWVNVGALSYDVVWTLRSILPV